MDIEALNAEQRSYQFNRVEFWLNGKRVREDIPPAMTTLEFLHKQRHLFGTKCSCNEGDCGACTVALAYPKDGGIVYEAINSCLYNAAKLHGKHLITVEALGAPEALHPIQSAMLEFHSTQCGYCTPGFVMSLFALFATINRPSNEGILAALEGNLCRCTGYDSILKAARFIADNHRPEEIVPHWCRVIEPELSAFDLPMEYIATQTDALYPCQAYYVPSNLGEFFRYVSMHEEHTLIGGGTDIMVQMNIQRKQYPVLIDLSQIEGLDVIYAREEGIYIGANVTYTQIMRSDEIKNGVPVLQEMIRLIASEQIRNFGTLAGNIANASPIGDTLPLLLALNAELVLESKGGVRKLPLSEFFLEYRKTALLAGEIIFAVLIPHPAKGAFIRCRKATKRKAVDISAVASAIYIETVDGIVKAARLAYGGVAAVPVLSKQFYKAMINMELQGLHVVEIADYVAGEFQPISDVRGSDEYRRKALKNQLIEYLNEYLGVLR
ncbi:MAG: FAD binding domain-containing protein [Candidatus Cloacimonadaceae bacterium]|nr:FAD binding domain-containing protein [Candidatus Cloacimonadaceae bacterium]